MLHSGGIMYLYISKVIALDLDLNGLLNVFCICFLNNITKAGTKQTVFFLNILLFLQHSFDIHLNWT